MSNSITRYVVQITDALGYFEDIMTYSTLEQAQKAMPLFLSDYTATRRNGRIIKSVRKVVDGSEMYNKVN